MNKTTHALKEAVLLAAEQVGRDGRGRDGLVGYLRRLALKDMKSFAALLGRVLPLQVEGSDGGPLQAKVVHVYLPDNGRPSVKPAGEG